jgi:GTP-binding protein
MTDSPFTGDQIEAGRKLFAGPVDFVKGVVNLEGLPVADRPEIAFAGRSNVGKSSLINALTGRKNLARASNTPGRTQELNFFDLGEGRLYMVDLPGYGFADAPKKSAAAWGRLTMKYLKGRATLKRVFLLIDSRRGVGEVDREIMKQLDSSAVGYQIILTKADKVKPSEVEATRADVLGGLKKHPAAHPVVMTTSSEKGDGLPELRAEILTLC